MVREKLGDEGNVFGREQHSGFDGARMEFCKNGFELLAQHFGRDGFDAENARGRVRWEAGNRAHAVNAEGGTEKT